MDCGFHARAKQLVQPQWSFFRNGRGRIALEATFLRQLPDQAALVHTQTGWYYFTGEKHADYTPQTGILGTEYNSPTGQYP